MSGISRLFLAEAAGLGLLIACSGTPPPSAAPPRGASWLCGGAPRSVSLQADGIPPESRPLDLALSSEKVSVLLEPARVVTLSRTDPRSVDMFVGTKDSFWSSIDRDPTDGSLWVASDRSVSLLRIAESGERRVVAGPPVEGQGGFRQIRLAPDAIYASPTGSQNAVWRLSREGRLLGQAFPRSAPTEAEAAKTFEPRGVFWLAHELDGTVAAFDLGTGGIYRAGADGSWTALPERFPARPSSAGRSLHGQNVGTSSESWYFTDDIRGFFFLPGGPVLLGSTVAGVRSHGTALFRLNGGNLQTATEDCSRAPLLVVASDTHGFVAASSKMEETTAGRTKVFASQVVLGTFPAAK